MTATDSERHSTDSTDHDYDVLVVGGGAAGLSAAIFTARFGLETAIFACGRSAISRCAHLENYLGFPGGIDPSTFLELGREQVTHEGATVHSEMVDAIEKPDQRFRVETIDGTVARPRYVIAATVIDGDYLESLDPALYDEDTHTVDCDEGGRTEVDGLYVAGRLADATHQAIICAGDGAEAGHTLVTDVLRRRGYWDEIARQYTDWVVRERRDDDWVSRVESWIRESVPDDDAVSEERIQWVIDDVVERFENREITESERRERVERGRDLVTAHLEP
ncbi:FAD-dependent oxidoreductase [Natronobacterium gregoryi]|uniref:NAD(P)/FAD-dependent oxidoreductase n=2 Tax=Natronobacterium gregoryi TaxID=44930 RepID=L0AEM1_NATGS|nr:FAD-dependent oxidoreductase [Natronobacterium gregoryi]AFZ72276.1 thioredoxin reductase [Natronobacterium gregoryi SP2]ELY62323.1 thioredoxin reductase [Natronobacterium gregoryi SP2]PLK18669.1 NAD(P)/FAD-dependent oxidoreductase [Natronobacterium gregoryi SP2]SFJ67688.1 Glucose inhibited division protein A [Natronobacterium gregoryi]